jgi:hypothetical protein
MDIFTLIILAFALLGLLAWQFGADSRDSWNSPEWERRQEWFGRR